MWSFDTFNWQSSPFVWQMFISSYSNICTDVCYVCFPTASPLTSMVMCAEHPGLTFNLSLVRSEPTYSQPIQQWTFISDFAVSKSFVTGETVRESSFFFACFCYNNASWHLILSWRLFISPKMVSYLWGKGICRSRSKLYFVGCGHKKFYIFIFDIFKQLLA